MKCHETGQLSCADLLTTHGCDRAVSCADLLTTHGCDRAVSCADLLTTHGCERAVFCADLLTTHGCDRAVFCADLLTTHGCDQAVSCADLLTTHGCDRAVSCADLLTTHGCDQAVSCADLLTTHGCEQALSCASARLGCYTISWPVLTDMWYKPYTVDTSRYVLAELMRPVQVDALCADRKFHYDNQSTFHLADYSLNRQQPNACHHDDQTHHHQWQLALTFRVKEPPPPDYLDRRLGALQGPVSTLRSPGIIPRNSSHTSKCCA
jgi:hypothetical protein